MAEAGFLEGVWIGSERNSAKSLITTHLRIRLTGPDKLPVKAGRCRVATEPDVVYPCDGDGIAHIPWKDRSRSILDLEWEGEGADGSFPWAGSVDVDIRSTQDADIEKRLNHLGFEGPDLAEKIRAYQEFMGIPTTGTLLPDARSEVAFWHDGGNFLARPKGPAAPKPGVGVGGGGSEAAAPAAPAEPEAGDPSWPRHVMIVPDEAAAKSDSVYLENVKFAEQWVKFKPSERTLVRISANSDLEEAVKRAAVFAKRGKGKGGSEVARKIILFVGHGAIRKSESDKSDTAFDTAPEPGKFKTHKRTLTAGVLDLGTAIRSGDIVVVDGNLENPVFKDREGVKMTDANTGEWNGRQNVRWAKWIMLNRTGHVLRDNHIEEFVLLSCSVGRDYDFAEKLAKLLETKVGLYKQKVVTQQVGSNNMVQIWLTPGDTDGSDDIMRGKPTLIFDAKKRPKEHTSLHEYPRPELQY